MVESIGKRAAGHPRGTRRLGRPPATDGAETRAKLIEVATRHFAERGYSDATLKEIAADAGLTTGAVYHYFSGKTDLFIAAAEDAMILFSKSVADQITPGMSFRQKLRGAFEAIALVNERVPDLAAFVINMDIESRRYPELVAINEDFRRGRDELFANMVLDGVRNGEVNPNLSATAVIDLISAFRLGLSRFAAQNRETKRHRDMIAALEGLLDGTMIAMEPSTSDPVPLRSSSRRSTRAPQTVSKRAATPRARRA